MQRVDACASAQQHCAVCMNVLPGLMLLQTLANSSSSSWSNSCDDVIAHLPLGMIGGWVVVSASLAVCIHAVHCCGHEQCTTLSHADMTCCATDTYCPFNPCL